MIMSVRGKGKLWAMHTGNHHMGTPSNHTTIDSQPARNYAGVLPRFQKQRTPHSVPLRHWPRATGHAPLDSHASATATLLIFHCSWLPSHSCSSGTPASASRTPGWAGPQAGSSLAPRPVSKTRMPQRPPLAAHQRVWSSGARPGSFQPLDRGARGRDFDQEDGQSICCLGRKKNKWHWPT